MFSSSKASRAVENREVMAHWCRPQFAMTHEMCSIYSTSLQIKKDAIIQTPPVVAIKRLKIKGPHMVEGGHHLRKAPNPYPQTNH